MYYGYAGFHCRHIGCFYNLALKLGKVTPFNMIWELQQFASMFSYSQVKDPKVYVDPSYEWISIGTETLRLDTLCSRLERLVQTIKGLYIVLSRDAVWSGLPGRPIVDDLSNVQRGYCFLDESPFKGARHSFFLSAVEQHKLGVFTVAGKWTWDQNAIQ